MVVWAGLVGPQGKQHLLGPFAVVWITMVLLRLIYSIGRSDLLEQICHVRPKCLLTFETMQSESHDWGTPFESRVHAKGVVLCERACFCLLSAF